MCVRVRVHKFSNAPPLLFLTLCHAFRSAIPCEYACITFESTPHASSLGSLTLCYGYRSAIPCVLWAGAEFLVTQGHTGEVAYGWQECRLMGDVLVLHDLVDDDSDSV